MIWFDRLFLRGFHIWECIFNYLVHWMTSQILKIGFKRSKLMMKDLIACATHKKNGGEGDENGSLMLPTLRSRKPLGCFGTNYNNTESYLHPLFLIIVIGNICIHHTQYHIIFWLTPLPPLCLDDIISEWSLKDQSK